MVRIRTTYWFACSSCGGAHRTAAELARHHCVHTASGADEHGHCRLCGIRVTVAHACMTPVGAARRRR